MVWREIRKIRQPVAAPDVVVLVCDEQLGEIAEAGSDQGCRLIRGSRHQIARLQNRQRQKAVCPGLGQGDKVHQRWIPCRPNDVDKQCPGPNSLQGLVIQKSAAQESDLDQEHRHHFGEMTSVKLGSRDANASGDNNVVIPVAHRIFCLSLLTGVLASCSTSPKPAVAEESFDEFYARMRAQNSFASSGVVTSKTLAASQPGTETNASLSSLPPPLLQLPQQRAARQEVEDSGVSPDLVKKMLAGEILSLTEIEELAQKKVSDDTIKKYLRSTGARYALTVEQIDVLRANSVSTEVIDLLLLTSASRPAERLLCITNP